MLSNFKILRAPIVVACFAALTVDAFATAAERPNVLLILVDDLKPALDVDPAIDVA